MASNEKKIGIPYCSKCGKTYGGNRYNGFLYCPLCGGALKKITKDMYKDIKIDEVYDITNRSLERWATLNEDLYFTEKPLNCEIFYGGVRLSDFKSGVEDEY